MLIAQITCSRGSFSFRAKVDLKPGVLYGLIGPSGSGKTTFLHALAGIVPADGKIKFKQDIWQDHSYIAPSQRRSTSTVFQENRLFPHLTVKENLLFAEERTLSDSCSVDMKAVVENLEIDRILEKKPEQLSGGQIKRVSIARSILSDPDVLLLDEPTTELEDRLKSKILKFISELTKTNNKITILVSHHLPDIGRYCEETMVISKNVISPPRPTQSVFVRGLADLSNNAESLEGSVLSVTVLDHQRDRGLTRLSLADEIIVAPISDDLERGEKTNIFVLARDVILASEQPDNISIRNCLSGQLVEINDYPDDFSSVVIIDIGGQSLAARITNSSLQDMSLQTGQTIFALIKTISVEV